MEPTRTHPRVGDIRGGRLVSWWPIKSVVDESWHGWSFLVFRTTRFTIGGCVQKADDGGWTAANGERIHVGLTKNSIFRKLIVGKWRLMVSRKFIGLQKRF